MRIFKTKTFTKWAKKHRLTDNLLVSAGIEVANGQYEASLGGSIYKKRVATKGRGKSGSARTIVACEVKGHVFYMFGFEKNERSTVTESEVRSLKLIAKGILAKTDIQLNQLLSKGDLLEVKYEQIN